jgi:hypothetical protein
VFRHSKQTLPFRFFFLPALNAKQPHRNHATQMGTIMWKSSARYLLAATNLLIAGRALAAPPVVTTTQDSKLQALNAASVKAVEGSWLDVPAECKARGFNADARPLAHKAPRPFVQHIYAAFGF